MTSTAAQSRVCSTWGVVVARVTQVVALVFLFASASGAFELDNLSAAASSKPALFSASVDMLTGKEVVEGHSPDSSQAAPGQQQNNFKNKGFF